jgi:hypothetical protein
MAIASIYTLLSLDEWASIIGIAPPHFNQAQCTNDIFPFRGSCGDVWFQHPWQQNTKLSREEVAEYIFQAEELIAKYLGYYPAPTWITQEEQVYPHQMRPENRFLAYNVEGENVNINLNFGKLISQGSRAVTLVGTPTTIGGTITYADADGDGYAETATVIVATTLTDVCELKVYVSGYDGAQEWEIRPARTKVIAGGFATFTFYTWQFILPELLEAFPTIDGLRAIDTTDTTNLNVNVEVYREYTDNTVPSVAFHYLSSDTCMSCGGAGCTVCAGETQDGCFSIVNSKEGIVRPFPASYNSTDGIWAVDSLTSNRNPRFVRINYYAGNQTELFKRGSQCNPLSKELARAIAYLATSMIEREVCSCANVQARIDYLRRDLASANDVGRYMYTRTIYNCPWGTREGAVQAWRMLSKNFPKKGKFALI